MKKGLGEKSSLTGEAAIAAWREGQAAKARLRSGKTLPPRGGEAAPVELRPARVLPTIRRELSLSERAFGVLVAGGRPASELWRKTVVAWDRPWRPDTVPGVSRAVVQGLCCPFSFRNFDFLNRKTACRFDGFSSPLFERWRKSFMLELGERKWPLFISEVKEDAVRLQYFQSEARNFAPHSGGRIRELTPAEWKAISATALEAARRAEIELEWDHDNPEWFVMVYKERAEDTEAIKAERIETMQRLTGAYGTKWPDDWLERFETYEE